MISMSLALAAKIDELDQLAKTRDDAWQISREQGELQAGLAVVHKAKLIVEVGTSYGFSGLWWAVALHASEGKLHTIDLSEKKYNASKKTFVDAGVSSLITNHLSDASKILPDMPEKIDLAFIDADKPSTQAYFDVLWSKLRVGGAILTDNVLSHQEEMGEYVNRLRQRDDAHSVTIPIRSGLEWTQKLR